MSNSKPVSTPIATGTRIIKATDDDKLIDSKHFQSIVGSLMWAMLCTRPDIAYTIQQLSQVTSKPSEAHLQAAKRALRYFQGTQGKHLVFKPNGNLMSIEVQAYADADYAADADRKSISGYLFMLAGSPICW